MKTCLLPSLFGSLFLLTAVHHISADVTVSTAGELSAAVANADTGGDTTILLTDGTYTLDAMLWIAAEGMTICGASGNRDAVTIRGRGMTGSVSHIFNVAGNHFTARDMTLRDVANHAVQLQVDVDDVTLRNLHILDTGEQMVKIAYDPDNLVASSDNGIMEECLLEYSAGTGPQYYIGGIDAHKAKNWTVRNNIFRGIRSPSGDVAEFAIHFWSWSEQTLVENNLIINCDRGIGFGLGDRGHIGGIIRNNMIYHDSSEGFADVGIAVESSPGTQIYHNTIFMEHGYPNAIEYRWPSTILVRITNNLTNRAIVSRDAATATLSHNVTGARDNWFAHLFTGDLHLKEEIPGVVDAGTAIPGLATDIDGAPRPTREGPDIGADEYGSGTYEIIPGSPSSESTSPRPTLYANDATATVTISPGTLLDVTVALDPGSRHGARADWWLAAETPYGLLFYTSAGWSHREIPAYTGALLTLEKYHLFTADTSTLTRGTYRLHFGVDLQQNERISWGSLFYHSVLVMID